MSENQLNVSMPGKVQAYLVKLETNPCLDIDNHKTSSTLTGSEVVESQTAEAHAQSLTKPTSD